MPFTQSSTWAVLFLKSVNTIELLTRLWIAEAEGAQFWLGVLTELKNRGVEQILIACVDGLSGFPDAIHAASKKWTMPIHNWKQAMNHFMIEFEEQLAPHV